MLQWAQRKWRARRVTLGLVVLVVVAGAIGVGIAGWRYLVNPLRPGLRAYKQGDWATAATIAKAVLQTTSDDRAALRLLARSSVHLGQDRMAIALYTRRLPEE